MKQLLKYIIVIGVIAIYAPFVFAAAPQVGTITPSSGTSEPNQQVTFTATYIDPDGWQNLNYVQLIINTSAIGSNCFYGYYNQNTNKLYLRNDANTTWQGGYAPGSNYTIANSYAKLDCSKTTVSGTGTTMTVKWAVTFKPAFSGKTYGTYLRAVDDSGSYTSFIKKGTWTINAVPQVGIIAPSSGTSQPNQQVFFTTTYTDPDGWKNLYYGLFLINTTSTSLKGCFYGYYNQNTNRLYLMNDAGTAWQGGYAPGSNYTIANSYAKLDCSKTTVSGTGTTMTVKWAVTFKEPFSGKTYNTYLLARDDLGKTTAWTLKGKWIVNRPPQVGTITPLSGASEPNQQVFFTTTSVDPDGWNNLYYSLLLINTSVNGANCFYGYYNQNTNRLYLMNDAGTAWQGGYAPGSNYTIANSYAKLDCSKTTVSGTGTTMTVKWAVTFKEPFSGKTYNTYLLARDDLGATTAWTLKGAWTITEAKANYWIILDEHDTPMPTEGYYYNYTGGDRGLLHTENIAYSRDTDSSYKALTIYNSGLWTWGGMWYSLIRDLHDNVPLDFKAIFGPYVKSEYQGEITEIEIVVNSVSSPLNNSSLTLKLELKDKNEAVIGNKLFTNLTPGTYTWVLPENCKGKVKLLSWIMDYALVGDTISIDRIRLKAKVPSLTTIPTEEQAFLWTYNWLMMNYDPATGMVQDRSCFEAGDFENVTATAKTAKIVYYAYKKGYTSYEDAVAIITKIADTLTYIVPRGPSGINLWPHFTCDGGRTPLPPRGGFAGTEWASGDTSYAALDIIAALQMIGSPQTEIGPLEDFLKAVNWADLLSIDRYIGHGYFYEGTKIPYYWKGFGMETIGVNWAYSSSTGEAAQIEPPPSDNGSGFIDNIQYPIIFSGQDGWGNNWDDYRINMANTQIGWYNTAGRNQYLANTGLFGLSAGETPEGGSYEAYGIGGKYIPANDGNGEVIVLHYCGMISDIKLQEAKRVWEVLRDSGTSFLQNKIALSPLNNMESMRVNKNTGQCTVNYLKGSWNLALQAEGWALADPAIKADLQAAVQNNAFLKMGYDILKEPHTFPRVLNVPQDYPTIQAAINAAQEGDTISVSAGTYNEVVTLNKSGIILNGNNRSAVLQGQGGVGTITCESITGNETRITGFKFQGGAYGIQCLGTAASLKIENNLFSGTGVRLETNAAAIIKGNEFNDCMPIYAIGNNRVDIIDNIARNTIGPNPPGISLNGATALIKGNTLWQRWDGALRLSGNTTATVINNKIVSCYGWAQPAGINISNSTATISSNIIANCTVYSTSSAGVGVDATNSNISCYNNVFYRNAGYPGVTRGVAIKASNTNLIAKNNIFYGNTSGLETIYFGGSGIQDFSYNDLCADNTTNGMTGIIIGPGYLTVDPLFVDYNNFQLNPGSPCIDAGDPAPQYNDQDGTRNDMGIYGGPDSF